MNDHYPFINTPLPYAYDALEPYIDEKTMKLHHDQHLQTYIDNLNDALKGQRAFQGLTLPQLILNVSGMPAAIQTKVHNNAGGVYNHRLYFSNLIKKQKNAPTGLLGQYLLRTYGSYDGFQKRMKDAALSVFGSGYAWLVLNPNGALQIVTTVNQDTPLPAGFCPILNLDVWEHAYYLKHYNERARYIDDWFHLVNWAMANEYYLRCIGR